VVAWIHVHDDISEQELWGKITNFLDGIITVPGRTGNCELKNIYF
jgi:hypothetical protein